MLVQQHERISSGETQRTDGPRKGLSTCTVKRLLYVAALLRFALRFS
jgi:hypothetical protein